MFEHFVTFRGILRTLGENVCNVGNKFFNLTEKNKKKLSPKKWNIKNTNIYRGYFPSDVNGKEGLDIGDLKITKNYAKKIKNQYIEHLSLNKSIGELVETPSLKMRKAPISATVWSPPTHKIEGVLT